MLVTKEKEIWAMPRRAPHSCPQSISLGISGVGILDMGTAVFTKWAPAKSRGWILYWLQGDSGQRTVAREASWEKNMAGEMGKLKKRW